MSTYTVRDQAVKAKKILRIFGFGTFSIEKSQNREKVVVNPIDYFFLISNLSICSWVSISSVGYVSNFADERTKLVMWGALTAMLGGSLVALVGILRVFINRREIWNLILKIDEISEKFKAVNVNINFISSSMAFIVSLIFYLIYIAIGLLLMYFKWGYKSRLSGVLIYGYLSVSFSFSMMWTTMFHVSVYLRLKMINISITKLMVKNRMPKIPQDFADEVIISLKMIHINLVKLINSVNSVFGFQTMLCVGLNFLFNLFSFLVAYKTFYFGEENLLNSAYTTMYWMVFYTAFTFLIIFTCNRVDSENSNIKTNLSKLTNRNICTPSVVEAFGHQVKIVSVKSTCGLFNFDYALIMMIISALATYFIIIIQFENSFKSKST